MRDRLPLHPEPIVILPAYVDPRPKGTVAPWDRAKQREQQAKANEIFGRMAQDMRDRQANAMQNVARSPFYQQQQSTQSLQQIRAGLWTGLGLFR